MSSKSLPKPLRELVRHWSEIAYEPELGIELEKIFYVNRWKTGTTTAFDLSEAVHKFHDGAARDLYKAYVMGGQGEWLVASAIARKILEREELPAELLTISEDKVRSCTWVPG